MGTGRTEVHGLAGGRGMFPEDGQRLAGAGRGLGGRLAQEAPAWEGVRLLKGCRGPEALAWHRCKKRR